MIRSREHLLHLLAEASELEHNLLCSYLFAAFSLKQGTDEDLSASELEAVKRWGAAIMQVCMEEMTHLVQVANIASAIGSRPHFDRPNLPVAPGYHPASVQVALLPFDVATLDHFIFLERPESARLRDAPGIAPGPEFVRRPEHAVLTPSAPDYRTIGEFYELLTQGFEDVSAAIGESALFVGSPDAQVRPEEIGSTDLEVVTDLESARAALRMIVVQGEGAPSESESSHFEKFSAIKEEYARMLERRPAFCPSRKVAPNPVMRRPFQEERMHVTGTDAAPLLDAANAVYALMLRTLVTLYDRAASAPERVALLRCAIGLMKVLGSLSRALTLLPAQDGSEWTAGTTFTVLRSTEGPGREVDASGLLVERLREIHARIPELALPAEARGAIASQLLGFAEALESARPA